MGFLGRVVSSAFGAALAVDGQQLAAANDSDVFDLREARARSRRHGKSGTIVHAGFLTGEEYNQDLSPGKWLGSPGKPGIAAKMMRDPHVRRSVDSVADPLCSAKWRFKASTKSKLDLEVADFCNWAFVDSQPWRQTLRRIVRGYAANGFHLEEMTDDVCAVNKERFPNHLGDGTGIIPIDSSDIPVNTITRFQQDTRNSRRLSSIEQTTFGSDAEKAGVSTVDSSRFTRFTYDQDAANYRGLAVLRSAYQPWKLKIAFLTIDAIKHERTGVGVPTLTLSDGASKKDINVANRILAEMRANEKGFLLLPDGYSFKWSGAGESESSNLEAAIARCNVDIAFNVASGFMLLGLQGKTGSHALSGTQLGAYHLMVDAHAWFVSDSINIGQDGYSPVRRIVEMNYGNSVSVPLLCATSLPTRDWLRVSGEVNKSVLAGVITADDALEDQIRASMDLGPRDEETSRKRPVSLGTPPKESDDDEEESESDD